MTAEQFASERDIDTLRSVRINLLRLHKALLDAERLRYERDNGRIESGMHFLNLVVEDPFFAWLRPFASLIVQIDERMEAKDPLTAADIRMLLEETTALTTADEAGSVAQRLYDRAVQDSPEVLMHHVKLTQLLPRKTA